MGWWGGFYNSQKTPEEIIIWKSRVDIRGALSVDMWPHGIFIISICLM